MFVSYLNVFLCLNKAILSPFVAKKGKRGRNGQPVGAVEDAELEEMLERIQNEDDDDNEDEQGIEGQDPDRLAADEATIEEIAETPDYTIDVDAAKEDIMMGKLGMSKVRVSVQVKGNKLNIRTSSKG